MKRLLVLLLLVLPAFAAETSKDEKDILAVLDSWKQASLSADAATLEKIFHKDLIYGHSSAKIENKAEAVAGSIAPATRSRTIDYHDLTTRIYGNTAVMAGKFDITTGSNALNHLYVAIVWLKGPEGWQIVARHSVKLP